jgi:hypothetical protein
MTEERFDELINLYLDNEIGRSDLGELKHVIKGNLVRRRKFERACQLHQAARKALTSPATSESDDNRVPTQRPTGASQRPSSSSRAHHASARDLVKNKQSQAHRNASVSVLAERQNRQGAASSVELGDIDIESGSGKQGGGAASRNYSFFDSPLGILAAILLTIVGALGMYFVIYTVSPDPEDDPGKFSELSPITQLDGGYDPKAAEELAVEIKRKKAAATATDAMRARLYQSALTGEAATNVAPVDYFSSHTSNSPTSTLSGNAIADLQPTIESLVPAAPVKPESTTVAPVTQP